MSPFKIRLDIRIAAIGLEMFRVFMLFIPYIALPNPDKFSENQEASISNDEITQPRVSAVLAHI